MFFCCASLRHGDPQIAQAGDQELLEGLIHDHDGIDCLLDDSSNDDPRGECEWPGYFCSGVLASWRVLSLAGWQSVRRSNATASVNAPLPTRQPLPSSWS